MKVLDQQTGEKISSDTYKETENLMENQNGQWKKDAQEN